MEDKVKLMVGVGINGEDMPASHARLLPFLRLRGQKLALVKFELAGVVLQACI